jgi:WD40 repeat protein
MAEDDKSNAVLHWRDRRQPADKLVPVAIGKHHVNHAMFSPDSRYLAAIAHAGFFKVFDAATRQTLFEKPLNGFSVSFARQSKMVAASDNGMRFHAWSVPDGKELARFAMPTAGHAGPFLDQDRLATWTGEDGSIAFIDTGTWTVTHTFPAHDSPIRGEAVSPDGMVLATLDCNGVLKIWDLQGIVEASKPLPPPAPAFVSLLNCKDLTGWTTYPKGPGRWKVVDGCITCEGPQSYLYTERDDYKDFHFRIQARINPGGNSGQYFRSQFSPGTPKGYWAQINNSDPRYQEKTGSLMRHPLGETMGALVKVSESLVRDDTWFTQEVIARGNHLQILVNGKKVVDFKDAMYTQGRLALEHYTPQTRVEFRKVEIKELLPE